MAAIQRMYDDQEDSLAELAAMVHVVELFSRFAEEWNSLTLAQRKKRFIPWMSDRSLWNVNERLQIGVKIKSFCDGSIPENYDDSIITIAFGSWCRQRENEDENFLDFTAPWTKDRGKGSLARAMFFRTSKA